MSDYILCGPDGEFEFEITYHRALTVDEDFYGEWYGPVRFIGGATYPAYTLQTEPLGKGRYRIRGHVLDFTKPGEYLNQTSEVRDRLGRVVEKISPPFRSILVDWGPQPESDEDTEE
jgi:hypothetical protein